MLRFLVPFALVGATLAFSADMQPSVVSHLLSEVEHSWEKTALAALTGQKDSASALADVQSSCQKVTKSIINGAAGEKDHVIEYMKEVCEEDQNADDKKMCEEYAAQIESYMTYDAYHNREELDLAAFCESFYKGSVTERASQRQKVQKVAEDEAKKQQEQRAKQEELKQHQAKAAASHNDVVMAEKEVKEAQAAIEAADAKSAEIEKTEQKVKTMEEHAQKELQAADEHEAAAAEAQAKQAADVAAEKKAKVVAARKTVEVAETKVVEKIEEKNVTEAKVEKLSDKKAGLIANRVRLGQKARLDINQKAYIEGQPVLGSGAGQGNLNKCMELADAFVKNPMAPDVKVCGTGIKLTVFLLGRCGEGSVNSANLAHTWDIGACDTGLPPSTCREKSPAQDKRMGVSQSYKITLC